MANIKKQMVEAIPTPAPVVAKLKRSRPRRLIRYGGLTLLLLLAIGMVLFYRYHAYRPSELSVRNSNITSALAVHHVDSLIVDAHRASKVLLGGSLHDTAALPVTKCFSVSEAPAYKDHAASYQSHSFAYLLQTDTITKGSTNCSLQQVVEKYGRPNTSILIAGTLDKPLEQLLFYDQGTHVRALPARPSQDTVSPAHAPATVVPLPIASLPDAVCPGKDTIFSVVAHQDDDIFFQSPDLLHDIQAGNCVRTVYLTAGDAGSNNYYWLTREQGSEAAYSFMTIEDDPIWVSRIIKMADSQYITIATPRNNPRVSLIFMRLPDGNVDGSGFKSSAYQSLQKLNDGKIRTIKTVDGQSDFSAAQIEAILTHLMNHYKPSEIRTQNTERRVAGSTHLDHSDHVNAGKLTEIAYRQYDNFSTTPIKYYVGYPIFNRPANVSAADANQKELTFLRYAKFDRFVCQTAEQCGRTPTYNAYFHRQYDVQR